MIRTETEGNAVGLGRELAEICAAVQIESPVAFTFAGSRFESPHPPQPPQMPPVMAHLQQLLYEHCYARRFDGHSLAPPVAAPAPDPDFVRRLVDANPGRERMDQDWKVTHLDASGRMTAVKGGVSRVFPPGKYFAPNGPRERVQPGMTVAVWLAKGSLSLQPGFYYVYAETLGEAQDPQSLLRLYWNVRAEGAPRLIAALAARLNRFHVPFQFKTLTQPEHYEHRTDGSVLYISRRFFPIVAALYEELAPSLADDLEADTPLFTKPLAPGLGLAEDPGTGDSFGLSRCRILASALWNAHVKNAHTPEARCAEVQEGFTRHGLTLEHPYLNPRSPDRYAMPRTEGGPR